jgi:two-component system, NarL family, nitrate/nitrite response regulator NarL
MRRRATRDRFKLTFCRGLTDLRNTATLTREVRAASGVRNADYIFATCGHFTVMDCPAAPTRVVTLSLGRNDVVDSTSAPTEVRVLVVCRVRIFRDLLTEALETKRGICVVGSVAKLPHPLVDYAGVVPDVVLLDATMCLQSSAVRHLTQEEGLCVVVLGIAEVEDEVIACAEAGVAGYVAREGSVRELISAIHSAASGEFSCPPHIAAGIVRRLATLAKHEPAEGSDLLTAREREIIHLVDRGLSNKEIAEHLNIQLPTVKNHIHNLLEKLGVSRREDAAAVLRAEQALHATSRLGRVRNLTDA